MTTKRKSLFAALAFALPIAALVTAPAMAAKSHKPKTHHIVHKAGSVHKASSHKVSHKHHVKARTVS